MKDIFVTLKTGVEKINQLSLRERGVLACILVVATVVVFLEFVWTPGIKEREYLAKEQARLEHQRNTLEGIKEDLRRRSNEDPNARLKIQNAQLRTQLEKQEAELYALLGHLVKPEEMVSLLQQVLKEGGGLRVKKLRSLPVTQIFRPDADNNTDGDETLHAHLYRHKVQIEIEAGFFETLSYLQRLEELQSGLVFNRLEYKVENYPKATVKLMVETIGLDKEWLGV